MIIKITEQIRENIRMLRKKKGIRGDELSKAVGKSPAFISRIETGKTASIEDTVLFVVYQNLLQGSNEDVQEYLDVFRDQIPSNDFSYEIDSLNDIQREILSDFINCLTSPDNSDQFLKLVVDALMISSQPSIPDSTEVFTAALAKMMCTWKQRRKEEELFYNNMIKIIK